MFLFTNSSSFTIHLKMIRSRLYAEKLSPKKKERKERRGRRTKRGEGLRTVFAHFLIKYDACAWQRRASPRVFAWNNRGAPYVELILGSHVSWIRGPLSTFHPRLFVRSTATSTNLPPIGRPVNDRKTTKASTARPHEQHTANISSRLVAHACTNAHVRAHVHACALPPGRNQKS